MDALRICGEAGWLYHRIQSYIHQVQQEEDGSKGIVARAVAGTLGDELREYHSLLTQYESQLANLSLRQLLIDLRMPTSRLHVLALLTDGLRHLSGGHLLSGLYKHALHGDSRHAKLAQNILCAASKPWFDILYTWTTQGVLSDPHGEFFVTESTTVDDKHLWNDKYSIDKAQIPEGILDKELVGPAFTVGKGINFIRRCLLDSKWTMHLEQQSTIEEDDTIASNVGGTFQQDLGYVYNPLQQRKDGNVALQRTLARAANLVHTHILHTLREENHLMQHLFALKQFLFLGQGDFFSALMDGLHSEFREQPTIVGIYKHSLLSIV
jgi:gamma-tubulin complex component 3